MRSLIALAVFALAPGCYLSHGREDASVPSARDVAVAETFPPIDAGPPPICMFEPELSRFVTDSPFAAHAPELGWDGERLGLVVFESDGGIDHPVVSFTRVSPSDLSADPLFRVGEESHSWGEAAWNGRSMFGLCWNGDPGGRGATSFRIRAREGAEQTERLILDTLGSACEGTAHAGDRWAAVWRHGGSGEATMRLAVLDGSGSFRGEPFDLDEPAASSRGAVLATDGDGFLAAVAHPERGVMLTRIDGEGVHAAPVLVPAMGAGYAGIAVHDDGTVGLAIRDGAREGGGLHFVRLDRALRPLPGETLLVPVGRGVRHPRVEPVPDGWAIVWIEQASSSAPATGAYLAHLDRRGVPVEPRRTLVDGQNSDYGGPSIVFHRGELFTAVARHRDPGAGSEQVEITRSVCAAGDRCAALDARSSGDDCAELTGFGWDGGECTRIVCGCIGEDCDRISRTEDECVADFTGC